MELQDLYEVSDEQIWEVAMKILPPETRQQVEEMFANKFGLDIIENLLNEATKKFEIPKEITENIIRGLRWKYLQLME